MCFPPSSFSQWPRSRIRWPLLPWPTEGLLSGGGAGRSTTPSAPPPPRPPPPPLCPPTPGTRPNLWFQQLLSKHCSVTAKPLGFFYLSFHRVVYQDGLYGADVYVRKTPRTVSLPRTWLAVTMWMFLFVCLFAQGAYPAAYRVAQSASAATATYSDG